MSERIKRILYITAFIILVGLIAFALYFVFFAPKPAPIAINRPEDFGGVLPTPGAGAPTPTPELPPGVLPPTPGIFVPPVITPSPLRPIISTTANGGIIVPTKLLSANGRFVKMANNGTSLNYYDPTSGLFSRVGDDGAIELLSSQVFRDVDSVTWAPTSDKAVLEFEDGSNIIYNFGTEKSYSLPNQFEDFSFSPDNKYVAAKDIKINPEERWLVYVDDTGGNKTRLEHLGVNQDRVIVNWNPNDQIVGTSNKGIDGQRSEVIFLSKDETKLSKAIVQGRDLRYEWSPSGNRMLYSVYNIDSNYQPQLWLTGSNPLQIDSNRVKTNLKTWADKCTYYSESAVYCAVPTALPENAGLLPDTNDNPDDIYRVDPNTGASVKIAEPLFPTQIEKVRVSSDGRTLFYVEQDSGAINKINL